MRHLIWIALAGLLLAAAPLQAQSFLCEDDFKLGDQEIAPFRYGPVQPPPAPPPAPEPQPLSQNPFQLRLLKYAALEVKHRLAGLASYYSTSLNGSLTANGERYYNKQLSAAHLTLPLGSWVEVTSVATGRKVRLRVNDRGPYVKKFMIDLSQAAARQIGVDVAADRRVIVRIIGLPGEEPLPDLDGPDFCATVETAAALK
ncbi:MAG TPA: septal ring lytic transglycosylase RlpA family protein [Thermoanaerobaculia bacterium]|jgi:rare lipoprotein A